MIDPWAPYLRSMIHVPPCRDDPAVQKFLAAHFMDFRPDHASAYLSAEKVFAVACDGRRSPLATAYSSGSIDGDPHPVRLGAGRAGRPPRRRCRPAYRAGPDRDPAPIREALENTTSFFVSGLGSGAYSANLFAGTRLRLEPAAPVRRGGVADLGHGRAASARLRRHAPAHHRQFGAPVAPRKFPGSIAENEVLVKTWP
jgi:hypothetical protein